MSVARQWMSRLGKLTTRCVMFGLVWMSAHCKQHTILDQIVPVHELMFHINGFTA